MSSHRSLPFATLLALLALLAGLLVSAPRAEASSTLLCKGFTQCAQRGYGNFGYAANYKKMWWRMYAGHNCTNYVAYRMVSRGMSATRPWSGSGDARNWGRVFASKVNQTPTVGSIAWWSANHVAYVEQVIDANTIVISEDHWRGDFDWRRIVRAGGGWPTGFIHLNDEALTATAAPRVTGTPRVDTPLTATAGTWKQSGLRFSYQWLANGVAIPKATAASFTPTAQHLSAKLSVRVTAARSGYRSATSVSTQTAATAPGAMKAVTAPAVTGTARVGGVLTVTGGSFTPAPGSTAISWQADGVAIPGATGPTLTLGPAQLDRRITAVVTARRPGYADLAAASAPTAPVGPEKLVVTREPALVGTPRINQALTVTPGVVGPAGVTTTYQWTRDGRAVPGATGPRYATTLADIGSRLAVQVTYSRPGYTSVVRTLRLPTAVRTLASVYARSQGPRLLTVSVQAAGMKVVRGKVTVVNARGESRTRTLVRGETTFRPTWLRAGRHRVTVVYEGSFRVDGRTATKVVVVR